MKKVKIIDMRLNFWDRDGYFYHFILPCVMNRTIHNYREPLYYSKSLWFLQEYFSEHWCLGGYVLSETRDCKIRRNYKQTAIRAYLFNKTKWLVSRAKFYGLWTVFSEINYLIYFYLCEQKKELLKMGVDIDVLDSHAELSASLLIKTILFAGPFHAIDYEHWNDIYKNLRNVRDFAFYEQKIQNSEEWLKFIEVIENKGALQ